MKRWYDDHENLSRLLEQLKTVHPKNSFEIVDGLVKILRESDPAIMTNFEIPSDIERWNKRWYDNDPFYWLSINCLRRAQPAVINKVEKYLELKLRPLEKGNNSSR